MRYGRLIEKIEMHSKQDIDGGSKFYCDNRLISETTAPSNMFCDECPYCGQPFSTHGTAENGLNVIHECRTE